MRGGSGLASTIGGPRPPSRVAPTLRTPDGRIIDLSGLPQLVIDALVATVSSAISPRAVATSAPIDEAGALDAVEAGMRLAAWAGGVAATNAGTLLRASWLADDREAESLPHRIPWTKSATHSSVVDEVALACGLTTPSASRMISFGYDRTRRSATLREHLWSGSLPLEQAAWIFAQTRELPDEVADEIAARVLAPRHLDEGTPGAREIRSRLAQQLQLHDPEATQNATDKAMRQRDVWTELHRDGTATLSFRGDPGVVTAASDRVRSIAKALKAAGDARTQSQLRADLAAALICHGQLTSPEHQSQIDAVAQASPPSECGTCRAVRAGELTAYPRAKVTLVMTFATLIGADDATGEIPGHGHLPAHVARSIALSAGSTWQRLIVDEVTGTAHTLDTKRYQPTDAQRAFVHARDHDCRGPDCTTPASQSDLDHDTPWPEGTTSISNLSAKHRRCHQHKTAQQWQSERDPYDDTILWTTRTGRQHLSAPHDYATDDHKPIDTTGWALTPPNPDDPPPF